MIEENSLEYKIAKGVAAGLWDFTFQFTWVVVLSLLLVALIVKCST